MLKRNRKRGRGRKGRIKGRKIPRRKQARNQEKGFRIEGLRRRKRKGDKTKGFRRTEQGANQEKER